MRSLLRPETGFALGVGVLVVMLVIGGKLLGLRIEALIELRALTAEALMGPWALAAILVVYILLTALPFVPGAEIGFALLVLLGAQVAGLVWLATVGALVLAYLVGRLVPEPVLEGFFMRLGLLRVAALLRDRRGIEDRLRPGQVACRIPSRWLGWMMRNRVLALALLVNTPGNTLLGGGGGIAMATGMSRMVSPREFLLSVPLAVAPVPLVFWLIG